MNVEGGCFCKQVRYSATVKDPKKVQCHCRECQYISGGGPNYSLGISEDSFTYLQGAVTSYRRADLEAPASRDFCPQCGTHLASSTPKIPGVIWIKVGTLDHPEMFEKADLAIFMIDKQPFHDTPTTPSAYERLPG